MDLSTENVFSGQATMAFGTEEIVSSTAKGSIVKQSLCKDDCTQLTIVLVMLSVFSVTGTIGNALVIYVFGRRKEKITSTMFILALAGNDFVTSSVIMPYTMIAEYREYKFQVDFACKLYNFCITFGVPLSCFIMVAIAIDRYFCICHPFMHAITVRRTRIILLCVVVFACSLGVITSLSSGVYENIIKSDIACNSSLNISVSKTTTTVRNFTQVVGDCTYENMTYVNFTGVCLISDLIYSFQFIGIYKKIYSSFFVISVAIVLVLYSLIYHSVRRRRAMRERQRRGGSKLLVQQQTCAMELSYAETQITTLNGAEVEGEQKQIAREQKSARDKNKVANLKTAFMLFVVTAVFIVAFTPAWLMSQKFLPINLILFYFHYIYNVSNPVIYSFMNQSFRDDLRKIFPRRKPRTNKQSQTMDLQTRNDTIDAPISTAINL